MTCRDRVLKAMSFGSPDTIPLTHSWLSAALIEHGQKLLDLFEKYPNDFFPTRVIKIPEREKEYYRPDGSFYKEWTDEWKCKWIYYKEGLVGEVKEPPLSDWSMLKNYTMPNPQLSTVEEREKFRTSWDEMPGYSIWGGGSNFFERMQWLRGVENYLCDIAEDRPEVYELADRVLYEHIMPGLENLFKTGIKIDVVGFGDDWGSQNALLINPRAWRKIFKPRYREMFQFCRKQGALVNLHSDGMTLEIVPDLIEIGLDCFNPQFSCMDLNELKRRCDNRLCILADIDRQHVIPFGKPAEIEVSVRNVYDIFGSSGGGLIWRGEIGAGVPLENVEALLKAFYNYREPWGK